MPKSYRSLRSKIIIGVVIPLAAVLALLSWLDYVAQRRLMMENLQLSASNTGEIIKGALTHGMLTNDFTAVQEIADNIAGQPGVQDVFLVNKQGRVMLSAGGVQVGATIDLADPTCQACHRYSAATRNESIILVTSAGARVFRNVNAIENGPQCQSCHASGDQFVGVLISDFSMATVDRQLAAHRNASLLWSVASILAMVLIVHLMTGTLVIGRLRRFVQAVKRLGQGDLDTRVDAGALDELGLLGESFNHMADGLKEKQKLEQSLKEQTLLRRQLLERLITVQEEERKRIALELHDQAGQALTSLLMTLKVLEEAISPGCARDAQTDLRAHVEDLRNTATQILKQVHDLALELRPSVLDDLGLLAALRHYLRGYQDRYRLPVDLQVLGMNSQRLRPEVETTFYRIMQEALTNVVRHAQASNVSVLLENRGHSVVLIVEDDGVGFDLTRAADSDPRDRLGLYGMEERVSLLGGTLTIESAPGKGTTVFAEIPLHGEGYEKNAPVGS